MSPGPRRFQGCVPGSAASPRSRQISAMMSATGRWSMSSSSSGPSSRSSNSASSASRSPASARRWIASSTARDDLPAPRNPASGRRSLHRLIESPRQTDRPPDRPRKAVERHGQTRRGGDRRQARLGLRFHPRRRLAMDQPGQIHAHVDQLMQDPAVILRIPRLLRCGIVGRGREGHVAHLRTKQEHTPARVVKPPCGRGQALRPVGSWFGPPATGLGGGRLRAGEPVAINHSQKHDMSQEGLYNGVGGSAWAKSSYPKSFSA